MCLIFSHFFVNIIKTLETREPVILHLDSSGLNVNTGQPRHLTEAPPRVCGAESNEEEEDEGLNISKKLHHRQ